MCGIHFSLSRESYALPDVRVLNALQCRGPDCVRDHTLNSHAYNGNWYLTFHASVLALRGDEIRAQPLIDPQNGSVLCWNGEAWRLRGVPIEGNDTEAVFQLLLNASVANVKNDFGSPCPENEIVKALANIAGPWAFVFYDSRNSRVYFGRDRLGRRSLLLDQSRGVDNELTVASVGVGGSSCFAEVNAGEIHCIDLSSSKLHHQTLNLPTPPFRINRYLPEDNDSLSVHPTDTVITDLLIHLKRSLISRIKDVPTYTANSTTTKPSRVAVLFSGGLDCTLLARLSHDILPLDQPIDLLNVAFENPRVKAAALQKKSINSTGQLSVYESCPDRITGTASFAELRNICPDREWRFVAIDVPYVEMLEHRSMIVKLMSPHNTEMDLSITTALYFAARGQGSLRTNISSSPNGSLYTTTARVLLSGLGADEIFGGYSRHAVAFTRGGYTSLIDELDLDFSRIGERNLGRDDRVISHWGREIRYPFLDEDFADFALGLKVWEKTGFRSDRRVLKHFEEAEYVKAEKMEDLDAAKMLLRCAAWNLGMKRVANEKKRAIQFGARTAKMHAGKTRGTDIVTEDDIMPTRREN